MKKLEEFILKNNLDYQISNWQGGETVEVYIYPNSANYKKRDFDFRFSYASVELNESKFTLLNGYNRILIPTKKDLTLVNNFHLHDLKKDEAFYFKGSDDVKSIGTSEDVNLMYNSKWIADMRSLQLPETLTLGYDVIGIFSVKGSCEVDSSKLRIQVEEKDCLIIKNVNHKKMKIKISGNISNSQVVLFHLEKDDSNEGKSQRD